MCGYNGIRPLHLIYVPLPFFILFNSGKESQSRNMSTAFHIPEGMLAARQDVVSHYTR